MNDCIFCAIVRREAPATIVDEGMYHLAFVPLNPHSPGHVLFIPKKHATSAVTNPRIAGMTFTYAARYLREMGPQGNLLTSAGPAATQTVDHLHVHVIPRGPGETLPEDWPWMRK